MVNGQYKKMLEEKSIIRQLSEFAADRGRQIGYENVFDFSLGNPSVPVPEKFTEVMVELLKNRNSMELHGYSPSLGIASVKEKIADSLNRRFGMNYTGNHIFPTTGAAGAVAHALRCVTSPGDEVLTFAPYFPEYNLYVNMTGAQLKVVPANTQNFQINFEKLEEMLTKKVAALLINTPNNPSGAVYSEETLKELSDLLSRKQKEYGHDIFLISDEPYREIVFGGLEVPYVSKYYDNTLSCYSYSKSLSLPGERIGYVAANPKCRDAELISAICGQISRGIGHNCPPSIIQLAVAEVVDQTSDMSVYEENMNLLYDELTSLGFSCIKPGGTFYIFPKALEENEEAFCRKALAYDLVLVPSGSFGMPGYFRMAYCIDTEKVKRSLPVIHRFVRENYQ
ncbi:MAG: pyridoxal phosphate-dependent aminotransferase [Lachnospiraceae bacterium]|nr:pyridoxal phosphate-dependent aminotransferase [Lachnospiraceae bacterium]GFI02805.1 aspartate aminotransferase [Lachnospiraceae bacterium]